MQPFDAPNWLKERENFLIRQRFAFSRLETDEIIQSNGVLATICLNDHEWSLFISDEYKDLDADYDPLTAEVVIKACLGYVEYESKLDWARTESLPVRNQLPLLMNWDQYRRAAQEILEALSPISEQITDFDWQLNAGRAAELRQRAGVSTPDQP